MRVFFFSRAGRRVWLAGTGSAGTQTSRWASGRSSSTRSWRALCPTLTWSLCCWRPARSQHRAQLTGWSTPPSSHVAGKWIRSLFIHPADERSSGPFYISYSACRFCFLTAIFCALWRLFLKVPVLVNNLGLLEQLAYWKVSSPCSAAGYNLTMKKHRYSPAR